MSSDDELDYPVGDKYNEKCGVFGCWVSTAGCEFRCMDAWCCLSHRISQNVDKAAHTTYYGLVGLQHRGQEGAGMVTSHFKDKSQVN